MTSLRWRLPFLIAALIAAVLATFVWAAHRTLEETLIRDGEDRLHVAADQLATLLTREPHLGQATSAAADPALAAYLADPTPANRQTAERALSRLIDGTMRRRVELWSTAGTRLLANAEGVPLPAVERVGGEGVGPLRAAARAPGDADPRLLFYDIVARVGEAGHLVMRIGFLPSDPRVISRFVGEDAVARLGNADGSLWTDLNAPIDGTRLAVRAPGVSSYVDARGAERVGWAAPVPAAPWLAWVEFPRASFLRPAAGFLRAIIPIAVIVLVAGAVLALVLMARVTVPLAELSAAAEAVAAGDYTRRVDVTRRDEIGRLSRSFNAMTGQIEDSRRGLETRVAERTAEADKANRAKSDFLSAMSHDLRTPLNSILGFAQLLETEALTPKQAEHVRHILNGGRHLLALVSDVLDITRIESGQLGLTIESVPVERAVTQAIELVRPLAAQRGIVIRMEETGGAAAVTADAQRLNQILLNLLSNAVKYNRAHGRVAVSSVLTEDGRCRLQIIDTGVGLDAAKIARLFQPFERLGAEQTAVEGTGLGLALSRALAAAMDGTIGVTSEPGKGSTFWLELPCADLAAAPAGPPRPVAAEPLGRQPQNGVVLYVEDNLSNVRLLQRILERRPGVQLLHASTGAAGVDLARLHLPDLLLLDMHLPDTTGQAVLRLLTDDVRTRDIPKVIVTADATPGLGARLEADGATACMTKPLSVPSVLGLIDRLLQQPGTSSDARL